MSSGRPASLDGSLLARKGDAAPAIPSDSPLTEELGEPRPEPVPLVLGGASASASRTAGDFLRQHYMTVLFLVLLVATLLFAATRLLPTASTASNAAPGDDNRADTVVARPEPAPSRVTPAAEPEKTAAAPTVASGVGNKSSAASDAPDLAIRRLSEAKAAPVVAIVPDAVTPKSKPRPPRPPAAVRSGRYQLQLASLTTAREADRELLRLNRRLRGVLGARKIAVVRAVPKGRKPVYRLRAGGFATQSSARSACERIRKLNIRCLVIRR